MAFNLFEGARRVAYLVTAISVVTVLIQIATYAPYVSRYYVVVGSLKPFAVPEYCTGGKSLKLTTPKNNNVHLTVCNYPDADGFMQNEVPFELPPGDAIRIDEEAAKQRSDNMIESLKWLSIGLLAFWIFVAATGWIVRGFFGISNGSDRKPVSVEKTDS